MKNVMILAVAAALLTFSGTAIDDNNGVPAKPLQLTVSAVYEGSDTIGHLEWRDMSDNELGF